MRPVLSTEKAQILRTSLANQGQREDQWGQLLKNIDGMYRTSNDDKHIRQSIRKQIYKDILEQHMDQQTHQAVQRHQKEMSEDAKIMEHWRRQGERLDRIEQERKRKLKEATNFNKQHVHQQMVAQTELPPIEPVFDVQRSYERDREKRKNYEREMMEAYHRQEQVTAIAIQEKYKKRMDEMQQNRNQVQRKQREAQEVQQRRQREFKRIADEHQQNMKVYNHVGTLLEDREKKEILLDRTIVVEGGYQHELKLMNEYHRQAAEEQEKRQHFVKDLQKQLEDDRYRDVATMQLEKNYDKTIVDNTINLYNHIERQRMIERTRANRELASTLVQQLNEKHHRELEEKNMDKKEARLHQSLIYTEGLRPQQLVSPLHIGNITYEDRMKQLNQVDRNLYQSLLMAGGGRVRSGATTGRQSFHLGQLPPPTEFYRSVSQQSHQTQRSDLPGYQNPEPSSLAKQGTQIMNSGQPTAH